MDPEWLYGLCFGAFLVSLKGLSSLQYRSIFLAIALSSPLVMGVTAFFESMQSSGEAAISWRHAALGVPPILIAIPIADIILRKREREE